MNAEQQPLVEHLIELRHRLMLIIGAILICFLILAPFAQSIYTFIARPLLLALPNNSTMIATDVVAPFFIPLKVALMSAFLITLPNTLYQIWAFIAPALYQNEKRLIAPLIFSSVVLFILGMAFCYFLVFPIAFQFFAGRTPQGVSMAPDISSYISFIIHMFLAFGIAFEVPVAVVLLNRMNIISLQTLKSIRRYIIVLSFVVSAILTPPDILSQIMLALPMILLYELGIWVCRFNQQNTK